MILYRLTPLILIIKTQSSADALRGISAGWTAVSFLISGCILSNTIECKAVRSLEFAGALQIK